VGIFGTCSGGRHAYLTGCRVKDFDAVVNCWGGGVVMKEEQFSDNYPVAPIDYTKELACPVLGLFGEEDVSPTPDDVAELEKALKEHGKEYEFHMYSDAGHGFFYHHRPSYRQEQAVDGWEKIFDFLGSHLGN
jgi:carboxymethylenebutenolidase